MKLPRLAASGRSASEPAPRGRVVPSTSYALQVCTTNLGATSSHPGDPTLPHCLVHVLDARGRRLRSASIGRRGLGPEHHADVPSRACELAAVGLGEARLRRFEQALQRCADEGYAWGERDCCSCLERAFVQGLGRAAPASIRSAAATLAAVPDPLPARSDPPHRGAPARPRAG